MLLPAAVDFLCQPLLLRWFPRASSLEETSASIEPQTTRNADSAKESISLPSRQKTSAEHGNAALESLQTTMKEINSGNDKVPSIIKSIDETAFPNQSSGA